MKKQIAIVLATAACALVTGAARASEVRWSVGINAPVVGAVISSGPRFPAPPIYVAPPVVYRPSPVYGPPAYVTGPVVYGGWRGDRARWEHERRERERWERQQRWEREHRERDRHDRWDHR